MKRAKLGNIFMLTGLLLIAAALALAVYNITTDKSAARSSEMALTALSPIIEERLSSEDAPEQTVPDYPDYIKNPDMEMPVEEIEGVGYIGVLQLPSLSLELPVIKEWSYPLLNVAPCRYTGSIYKGDMVIAAHSFKSHFGRLKDMQAGDQVIFTDSAGNTFYYTVAEVLVLGPYQVEEMTESEYELSLFSCTYDSRARVTVRCQLTDTVPNI